MFVCHVLQIRVFLSDILVEGNCIVIPSNGSRPSKQLLQYSANISTPSHSLEKWREK